MDIWEMFSEMCKKVVEEQNVFLQVIIVGPMISMYLVPYDEELWEEDDDD
jgi:hypothetical protein